MEDFYWALEYGRVFLAYFFIMFLWPSVVFKKHLKKKKSRTYKFVFCSVVQPIVINTAVLGLGLIKCLNNVVIFILFYGVFFFFLFKDVKIAKKTLLKGKYLVSGTYGPKTMFSDFFKFIKKSIKSIYRRFLEYMRGHWFEYSILFVLVVFGMMYFSVNAFEEHSYGFGDLYTHNSWIYNLAHGNIFSGGIYPEAMHCLILLEYVCFGLTTYNALLFTGPIFAGIILVCMYIMFKELFHWKYSPMIALTLILVIDLKCDLAISSFSRWQWTMPQEYGYPAMFCCVTYVIRYFKNGVKLEKVKWRPKFLRDDDLFLFTFSLAASIAAHFYSVIMAFMLCLGAAIILLRRFFSKKFMPFIVACLVGVLISSVPMLGAALEGYKAEGSIRWALSLIFPKDKVDEFFLGDQSGSSGVEEKIDPVREKQDRLEEYSSDTFSENDTDELKMGITATFSPYENLKNFVKVAAESGVIEEADNARNVLKEKLNTIYYYAYVRQYGEERAKLFIYMSFIVLGLWFVVRIYTFVRKKINKEYTIAGHRFDGYIVIVFGSFLFTATYALGALGLPELLEQYRVCAIAQIMSLAMLVIPVDILGTFIFDKFKKQITNVITAILVIGVYVGAKLTGTFHGYLMIELTRYNSAVMVTKSIINDMGGNTNYTIISSTDELYPVLDYGYHEELITFINSSEYISYTIPTEYLFIMIEKKPLARANHHVASGPSWLAEDKYQSIYGGYTTAYPEIRNESISEEYANLYFGRFPEAHTVYNTLWKRVLLNSKAFVWCQKFNAMYPNELHVYYEDDDFLCYYLRQNPKNLYELAVMDPSVMVAPEEYKNPIWPETYANEMNRDPEIMEIIYGMYEERDREAAEKGENTDNTESKEN